MVQSDGLLILLHKKMSFYPVLDAYFITCCFINYYFLKIKIPLDSLLYHFENQ